MRAYCYASGHIQFGARLPTGAMPIARGRPKPLRDFIQGNARHGYRTRRFKGRSAKIRGSEILLVPGVPEAVDQIEALAALTSWLALIGTHAPHGVEVR